MAEELMMTVVGLQDILREFDRLGDAVSGQIAKKALKAGNQVILPLMEAKVPVLTGELKLTLGERVVVKKGKGKGYGIIGPQRAKSRGKVTATGKKIEAAGFSGDMARIAHAIENGHTAADGTRVEARPFARPARDEGGAKAEQVIHDTAAAGIAKVWDGGSP